MTKSPTAQTPELQKKPTRSNSWSWGRSLFTLIFRLLLLGVGGSLAAAVGIAVAQLYPAQTQEPPFVEKLMQSSESLFENLKQLPSTWNQKQETPPDVAPSASAPAPTAAATAPLSDTERQQLQTELTQLQAELQTLTSSSTEPLANRVQELQKRIQAIQERLSSFTANPTAPTTFVAPATSNQANRLMVTLPSDALFNPGQTTLRSGTETILNSILTDLKRYPGAAIQVGGHVDQQSAAETDRQRSLEQAKAVQQYLSTKLGDQIHWVTVGYGHSRPLAADDSSTSRQRNRRIEITIDPE